jgi:hypothetical protein
MNCAPSLTEKFAKRSLQWTPSTAGRVCFVDKLWQDRQIDVPAEIPFGTTTVALTADLAYEIEGYQDDLVVSFGPYLLHVLEEADGYAVLSLTTSMDELLRAYRALGPQ